MDPVTPIQFVEDAMISKKNLERRINDYGVTFFAIVNPFIYFIRVPKSCFTNFIHFVPNFIVSILCSLIISVINFRFMPTYRSESCISVVHPQNCLF